MRVVVRVTPEAAEAAGEILLRAGCAGWESPAPDTVAGYLPADERAGDRLAELWEQVRALEEAGLDAGPADVLVEMVPERPWEEVWKTYFRPTRVGRVVLCPTWEQVALNPGEVLVLLDPGMAFGSGAHATTRLCLAALQEALPESGGVLDVGTGSGILAIAAARLGAARVLAVDNDPEVLPIAAENAALNGVAERVEIRLGDIAVAPALEWQVIVANIAPDPVKQAAPTARALLAPGGHFITGGIPETRALEVEAALTGAGLAVERVCREDEWATVIARKPA